MPDRQLNRATLLRDYRGRSKPDWHSHAGSSAADASDLKAIQAEIDKRHDEAVQRLQDWIRQPSIAAEKIAA